MGEIELDGCRFPLGSRAQPKAAMGMFEDLFGKTPAAHVARGGWRSPPRSPGARRQRAFHSAPAKDLLGAVSRSGEFSRTGLPVFRTPWRQRPELLGDAEAARPKPDDFPL